MFAATLEEIDEEVDAFIRSEKAKLIIKVAKNFDFKKEITHSDDYRSPLASSKGGFELRDPETTSRLRSAATELLKMAGQKILNGEFNLTQISFPIKCMGA